MAKKTSVPAALAIQLANFVDDAIAIIRSYHGGRMPQNVMGGCAECGSVPSNDLSVERGVVGREKTLTHEKSCKWKRADDFLKRLR